MAKDSHQRAPLGRADYRHMSSSFETSDFRIFRFARGDEAEAEINRRRILLYIQMLTVLSQQRSCAEDRRSRPSVHWLLDRRLPVVMAALGEMTYFRLFERSFRAGGHQSSGCGSRGSSVSNFRKFA